MKGIKRGEGEENLLPFCVCVRIDTRTVSIYREKSQIAFTQKERARASAGPDAKHAIPKGPREREMEKKSRIATKGTGSDG